MEALITKFMAWLGALLPAAIGSALSVYLDREKTRDMSKWEILAVFLFGISLAHYMGGAAIEYWHLNPMTYVADAIKLTIGFIGMATLSQTLIQMPELVAALRKRWIG
jgi:hypothetical protein